MVNATSSTAAVPRIAVSIVWKVQKAIARLVVLHHGDAVVLPVGDRVDRRQVHDRGKGIDLGDRPASSVLVGGIVQPPCRRIGPQASIERVRIMRREQDGTHVVSAYKHGQGEPRGDDPDQGHGHGRDGLSDQCSRRDAEGQRKGARTHRQWCLLVEPVPMIGRRPHGVNEAHLEDADHGGRAQYWHEHKNELRQQPACARYSLCPGEPVRAILDITRPRGAPIKAPASAGSTTRP
jgi:hypothetical protein